tara:strand:+ start:428 stop:805 length:378 start_codon:yes stop_codon:yes gene_type:complete
MTPEQKEAAAERLRLAREKRLRENPPKYSNIHPSVLRLPDEHPFSRVSVTKYIKTQKEMLPQLRAAIRNKVKGAIAEEASTKAYIRHCETYLRNGDWCDNYYGEYQEKKVKWVTIVPAGKVDNDG